MRVKPSISTRVTVYAVVLGIVVVGVATALALRGPTPELGPVLVLGALFALAENQVVELPDHADVSISFMLGMAAIVVFSVDGSLLGPMLVGICGAIYVPHLARWDWRKVCINSANFGLAMLAAAAVFNLLVPSGPLEPGPLLLLALPAAVVFSIVNIGLYSLTGLVFFGRFPDVVEIFGPLLPQTYPFSILGVFLGLLYVDYGVVFVPLFVVPILVARQTFASYLQLKESQEAAVRTLIGALEAKDPYTAGHAERGRELRAVHRPGAEHVAVAPGAAPLRGTDARRRQARRAEPPAQQAGQADRGGVRCRPPARRRLGRDPDPHRLPRSGRAERHERSRRVRARRR